MKELLELTNRSRELTDLQHILGLLQWDQEVNLPSGGAAGRAEQIATLAALIHRKQTDPSLGNLLDRLEENAAGLDEQGAALVRVMRREYDKNTKLPEEFVVEFARTTSQAFGSWVGGRRQSDFSLFQAVLEKIVVLCREKADRLGYGAHPYDALLDLHEEGLATADVEHLFGEIRDPLRSLLAAASPGEKKELIITPAMEVETQTAFSRSILEAMGFDFSRGRLDLSPHPFSACVGPDDHRLTNRYNAHSVDFIFSAMHEGGHGLYEQGVDMSLGRTHLGAGISLGIHESQSRLWENCIGRSREFWECFYPLLQEAFPRQFQTMSLDGFIASINVVTPGPIRVEADEVSYNLHILIRFEIEKALIEGSLKVIELPDFWRSRYADYLGITVKDDAHGVLQDVHWSHGSFGYFPTYTLGNLAAAQIWTRYREADPGWGDTLRTGNLQRIREWLGEAIHRHGSIFPPRDLLRKATGEDLKAGYLIEYLEAKYRDGKVSLDGTS